MRLRPDGWTGGAYSVYRALLGTYLFVHFARLLPWGAEVFSNRGVLPDASMSPLSRIFPNVLAFVDGPAFVTGFLAAACIASILVALGSRDRWAAVFLWYVLTCLLGRNPLIANPSLPFVGWLLLAHALTPPAPLGSLAARGRVDPGGGWTLPRGLFAAAWIVMAVAYSYSGVTKLISPSWLDGSALRDVLTNPLARPGMVRQLLLSTPPFLLQLATWGGLALELLFAPLALVPRLRPLLWMSMVGLHLGLLVLVDFADLTAGMLLVHAFTFDPAWIPGAGKGTDRVLYDGGCGLCHGAVRFLLAEDRAGDRLRYAPLEGETTKRLVPEEVRRTLPDSLVLLTEDGRLLVKSEAVRHALARLGGLWRVVAVLSGLVPRLNRDAAYDLVAKVRRSVFAKPADVCPILPAALRERFDP